MYQNMLFSIPAISCKVKLYVNDVYCQIDVEVEPRTQMYRKMQNIWYSLIFGSQLDPTYHWSSFEWGYNTAKKKVFI